MAWLGSSMHNCIGVYFSNKLQDTFTVSDIYFVMKKIWKPINQPLLIPPRLTLRPKEICPHIIIYSVHAPALICKKTHHFTTNKAAGSRHNYFRHILNFIFFISWLTKAGNFLISGRCFWLHVAA